MSDHSYDIYCWKEDEASWTYSRMVTSNDMKCQLTWYMIHDAWYMIHDTWYTRSYTLWSVPSSLGRSFFILPLLRIWLISESWCLGPWIRMLSFLVTTKTNPIQGIANLLSCLPCLPPNKFSFLRMATEFFRQGFFFKFSCLHWKFQVYKTSRSSFWAKNAKQKSHFSFDKIFVATFW